jgi:hypothetical protein
MIVKKGQRFLAGLSVFVFSLRLFSCSPLLTLRAAKDTAP